MNIAVSGPVNVNEEQREFVHQDFATRFTEADTIYSGSAFGVDTVVAKLARHENAQLVLVAPKELWHNANLYCIADEIIHVEGTYMQRNDRLADEGDELIAYPKTDEEELQSGTWATIRRFRARGKKCTIVPLDGSPMWEERTAPVELQGTFADSDATWEDLG